MRRPHLALSVSAAAVAAVLSAAGLRAQTAPGKPGPTANPMAASRGARSLLRNGTDYLDYGEPERALELLREAEGRQFELTDDERTKLNQAIVRARQALRAGDATGTKAPVTVRNSRSRRAGSIVLNTLPTLPRATTPAAEPIQLTSGERVEPSRPAPAAASAASAPAPLLTPTPELTPDRPAPAPAPAPTAAPTPTPAPTRLADEVPPSLLEEPAPAAMEAAPVEPPAESLATPEPVAEMPALPAASTVTAPPRPEPVIEAAPVETTAEPMAEMPALPAASTVTAPPRPEPVIEAAPVETTAEPMAEMPALPAAAPAEPEPQPVIESATASPVTAAEPVAQPAEMPTLPTQVSAPPAPERAEVVEPQPITSGDPPPLAIEAGDPLASDLVLPAPTEEAPAPAAAPELPALPPTAAAPELPVLPEPAAAAAEEAAPVEEAPPVMATTPEVADPVSAILPIPAPLPTAPDAPIQRTAAPTADAEPLADEPPPPPAEEVLAPPAAAPSPALPPLPTGSAASTAAPETRTDLLPAGRGESLISPETRREVEELARRQRMDMRGGSQGRPSGLGGFGPGTRIPSPVAAPTESEIGAPPPGGIPSNTSMIGYGTGRVAETRIELPRPPSPTEPRPIRSIPVPEEYVPHDGRRWAPGRKVWAAASTGHGPLYFQDAVLERYGQSVEQAMGPAGRFLSYPIDDPRESNLRMQIVQPFYSIGKFGAQVATLPIRMVLDPPWEPEYDLGYYRPGDRIPPDTWYFPAHGVGPPLRGSRY